MPGPQAESYDWARLPLDPAKVSSPGGHGKFLVSASEPYIKKGESDPL